jgi:hypothetical protein
MQFADEAEGFFRALLAWRSSNKHDMILDPSYPPSSDEAADLET